MERFVKLNKMLHLVYPETLNRLVVANVPGVFGVIYNIFKPIRTPRSNPASPGQRPLASSLVLLHPTCAMLPFRCQRAGSVPLKFITPAGLLLRFFDMFGIARAVPQRTLSKISILSEGDESMHGFAVLLGADNELAKTGRAEVLFQEVLAGRIERRK